MSNPIRVLIVEDRPEDAELMQYQLRQTGFDPDWTRVDRETDYLAALETNPDLILADWSLPHFSGLRALQLMKERGLDIAFVIVSGRIGEQAALEAMREGAVDYLMKDRLARLGMAARNALEIKQLRELAKQEKARLTTSEELHRTILETALDGFWLLDMQGRLLEVNAAYCQMSGYTAQEVLQRHVTDLEFIETKSETAAHIQKVLTQGQDRFETRHRRKDGSIFDVEISVLYRPDKGGQMVAFLRDITERKQAEEALRESEEKHRTLIEQSLDGIVISDEHGNIAVWNKSMESITGMQQCDTIGRPILEIQLRLIPDEQKIPGLLEQLQSSQKNILESKMDWPGESREQEIIHVNGTHKVIQDSSFIIKINNNVNFGTIIHDITKRKRAEEKLKEYSEHLEEMVTDRTRELSEAQEQLVRKEKLATLGQLAGSVGHELRNPLGVINTSIYYLKMVQPDAGEKIKRYHAMIEQEVHNADKIISDLLDFARGINAEREPASVPELVQRVLERFPAPPPVKVRLEIPADLPMVFADPRQVEQVLDNLVVNAYQAMASQKSSATGVTSPAGTISTSSTNGGKLVISAKPSTVNGQSSVAIAVKDTGTGITPENMQKLFEPLFTTKAKGIGLGLAVSRKLAEANGGRIEVQSELGVGSTFTLVLLVWS